MRVLVENCCRASYSFAHAKTNAMYHAGSLDQLSRKSIVIESHRIVICLTMSPPLPVIPPSLEIADADPGFFSKIFQNLRLSSAAVCIVSIARIGWEDYCIYLRSLASDHRDSSSCVVLWFHELESQRCVRESGSSRCLANCLESHSY